MRGVLGGRRIGRPGSTIVLLPSLGCARLLVQPSFPCRQTLAALLLLTVVGSALSAPAAERRAKDHSPDGPGERVDASAASPIIDFINTQIREGWTENKIQHSDRATDGEWCRRVYLDLIGRIPTVAETERFLSERGADKRTRLVERLLSPEYADDYARYWTTIWENLLIGRRGGRDNDRLVNREGLESYLHDSFYQNKPYQQFVAELVGANGANKPGEPDFNGAVNFLLDNLQDKATPATAKTARLFLGLQVQCTQCHDHPFNTWKQQQFWGFNAFFRQARALRTYEDRDIVCVRLEDEDFPGEAGNPETGEIYFERRNNTAVAVLQPTFVDGTTIKPSGYVDDVNRRDELARLIPQSPLLSQAIVNRTWAHFLGYGFTKPVDDMGPHNKVSHPALLERLASEFAAQGHDLKKLARWIVLSEPYALSSRLGKHNADDEPALGSRPFFSRFYLRQMRPEELYDSLVVATQAGEADAAKQAELRRDWLSQFTIAFGTDENDESSTFNGTIPQALMLMNGSLVERATTAKSGAFLHEVAGHPGRDVAKITELYLAALARQPTRDELAVAQKLWLARQGSTTAALEDIWWALLNSNEFILNH